MACTGDKTYSAEREYIRDSCPIKVRLMVRDFNGAWNRAHGLESSGQVHGALCDY